MSSRLIYGYLIGALLLALLYILAIPFYEKKIPAVIQQDVREQFVAKGYDWVQISADGRDITLQGKSPNPAEYEAAVAFSQTLSGVRGVDNQLRHTVISPYSLNAEWENKQLNIKGYLPDEASVVKVTEVLNRQYGEGAVKSQFTVAKGAPEGWSDLTTTALENTPQLDMVRIDLVDQALDLSAKTAHSADSERLLNSLRPFEEKGYTLKTNVVATDLAAQRCQKRFNQLLQTTRISFNSGKAIISVKSIPLLQTLAETAQLCPGLGITIAGYTDNRGSAAKNLTLSKQRADAVAKWLINSGLDGSLLKTVGHGADKPVADNATEEGRAQNRRIEFTVQEK